VFTAAQVDMTSTTVWADIQSLSVVSDGGDIAVIFNAEVDNEVSNPVRCLVDGVSYREFVVSSGYYNVGGLPGWYPNMVTIALVVSHAAGSFDIKFQGKKNSRDAEFSNRFLQAMEVKK